MSQTASCLTLTNNGPWAASTALSEDVLTNAAHQVTAASGNVSMLRLTPWLTLPGAVLWVASIILAEDELSSAAH
jgi:hypothetical protein